jgi:hypothetical protein
LGKHFSGEFAASEVEVPGLVESVGHFGETAEKVVELLASVDEAAGLTGIEGVSELFEGGLKD